jgi:Tfp pilus assembly protein PilO
MTATRKWSALTVVVIVAVFAASWFLLIAPKRSEAAGLRTEKSEQDANNQRLLQQLEVLKAQAQDLPKQEAFLAKIRRQVPDNPALPTLIRDLTAAAKKSGITLVAISPGLPVAFANPAAVAAVPTTATTAGSTTTSTTTTPPVAAAPAPTLYEVPLVVKTGGEYYGTVQFLNYVEGLKRSFLVQGFTLRYVKPEATSFSPGPVQIELTGGVYMSPAAAAAVTAATGASAPVSTPAPSTAPAAN